MPNYETPISISWRCAPMPDLRERLAFAESMHPASVDRADMLALLDQAVLGARSGRRLSRAGQWHRGGMIYSVQPVAGTTYTGDEMLKAAIRQLLPQTEDQLIDAAIFSTPRPM